MFGFVLYKFCTLFDICKNCNYFVKKKPNKKKTWNLLGAQAVSKAPSQSVTAKIFSATKYFDPPKEIKYQQKNHHIGWTRRPPKYLFSRKHNCAMFNAIRECFAL